jgi:hypothetical protein
MNNPKNLTPFPTREGGNSKSLSLKKERFRERVLQIL